MSQCPYCETTLEPETLGGKPVDSCPSCGGTWVSGATLTAVVKDHVAELAPFEQRHPDRHGTPPLGSDGEHCAQCGELLAPRTFPLAPDLPVLACAACKYLFFKHGQLRALHETLSPTTLPPPPVVHVPAPAREAPLDEDEPPTGARGVLASLGLNLWWTPPMDGQNWLSWVILGMPIWMTLLVVLGAGLCLMGALGAGEHDLGLPPLVSQYAVFVMFGVWPIQTLALALVLYVVWFLGEGAPPEGFGEVFIGLLKVTAVGDAIGLLLGFLTATLGMTTMWTWSFLISRVVRLLLYRLVLELEWREVWLLTVLGGFVPGASVGV